MWQPETAIMEKCGNQRLLTCVYLGLHKMWRLETIDLCIFRSPLNVETGDCQPVYIDI